MKKCDCKEKDLTKHTLPIGNDGEMINPDWFNAMCNETHRRMVNHDGFAAWMASHLEQIDPDEKMTQKEIECLTAMILFEAGHRIMCTTIQKCIDDDEVSDGFESVITQAIPCVLNNAQLLQSVLNEMYANDRRGEGPTCRIAVRETDDRKRAMN
jgi:hypothetical protein